MRHQITVQDLRRDARAAEDSSYAANRAALPTTPKYPPPTVSPEALFKQLQEMGVGCESCVSGPQAAYEDSCDTSEIGCDLCSEWEGK